jgi:hypothetical protein
MSIIADRGLFVRLLVQSGKFASADAEAFADATDAATREPASKADLMEARNELKAEMAALRSGLALLAQRVDAQGARLDGCIDALGDKLMVRHGGLMIALSGALFAALRLTQP